MSYNNTNRGGGGGGGRSGGRSSGGRNSRNSSNYRGGNSGGHGNYNNNSNNNSHHHHQHHGGGGGGRGGGGGGGNNTIAMSAVFRPCKTWTTQGSCPHGDNCSFAHIVKIHGVVDASSFVNDKQQQNNNNNNRYNNHNNFHHNNGQQQVAPLSSVSIWESSSGLKMFSGGHDGHWRLWNTSGGNFMKEFESNMRGKVDCLQVVNNFLFCGFEAVSLSLPDVTVGMVHAWNLQQPSQPPLELHIQASLIPYAHNQAVTALSIAGDGAAARVVSGSKDGTIRIWTFQPDKGQFVLMQTLVGHARQVTGLVLLVSSDLLWSCATDGCIRIWKLSTGECQYSITRDTPANPQAQNQSMATPAGGGGVGHTHAVTSLLSFESAGTTFILTSSLDRTVKAWNATTGVMVASEAHDEGVVCMCLTNDPTGNHQLLLIGLESGNIMCRNLIQTPKSPAFQLLFTLSARFSQSHEGSVKSIAAGPASTFYSAGSDGKLMVFQLNGDLGLQ